MPRVQTCGSAWWQKAAVYLGISGIPQNLQTEDPQKEEEKCESKPRMLIFSIELISESNEYMQIFGKLVTENQVAKGCLKYRQRLLRPGRIQ